MPARVKSKRSLDSVAYRSRHMGTSLILSLIGNPGECIVIIVISLP